MRGHEPIITMRRNGRKPATVYLETSMWAPEWADWPRTDQVDARVHIEARDSIERLDLRFVIGCQVRIDGNDQPRVRDLFAAARDHGAERVIAHVMQARRDTFDIVEILDTHQELTLHG